MPPAWLAAIDAFLRRGLDICASIFGLLVLAPFFIWIAIRIRQDSPGPIFYRGPRIGRFGKNFGILKFRTMHERPESYRGALVTARDDPRITPFGAWLRNTKINELPQLWNVLVGDMSLVGPRPEDPKIAENWPASVRSMLLKVRPGITSPATILYRDEEAFLQSHHSVMDDYLRDIMPSKLRLDTLYIKNRSILTDLDIVFWTVVVLLPYIKRIPIPQHRLYWGPLAIFTSRYLSWFLIDALIAFSAIGLTGLIWRTSGPLDIGVLPSIGLALIVSVLFSVINALLGLYAVEWSRAPASDTFNLGLSITVATMVILFPLSYFIPEFGLLPGGLIIVSAVLSLAGFITVRYKERLLTGLATRWLNFRSGASAIGERILIVGAGENSQVATWFLRQSKLANAFTVVGMVDDDPRKLGLKYDGNRVIGTTRQIPELAKKYDIGVIFYTITNISKADRLAILARCAECEAIVAVLPDMLETLQERFVIANTIIDFREEPRENEIDPVLLAELDALAQAEKWDALKDRLAELRMFGGTNSVANRYPLHRDQR